MIVEGEMLPTLPYFTQKGNFIIQKNNHLIPYFPNVLMIEKKREENDSPIGITCSPI